MLSAGDQCEGAVDTGERDHQVGPAWLAWQEWPTWPAWPAWLAWLEMTQYDQHGWTLQCSYGQLWQHDSCANSSVPCMPHIGPTTMALWQPWPVWQL